MQKDFKLTVGTVRVVDYQANIDIYYWKNGNNEEADSSFIIYADDCHNFTTDENIEFFLENMEYEVHLSAEDRAKLKEELHGFVYNWSSEIFEED